MADSIDRRSPRPSRRPPPGSDAEGEDGAPDSSPPSSRFDGEDFLYHLYRGSELLQDNCIPEAKEELERALSMQPRDVEGQGLLGVVYFRLGLYPRAIEIYGAIIREFPAEITPRMNLALCYVKTGQHLAARETLEHVLRIDPEHRRAWGYLGLVFERLREYTKAQAAFERAGQANMVRRMQERLDAEAPPQAPELGNADVRRVAADAVMELEVEPTPFSHAEVEAPAEPSWHVGRWRALEPGREQPPPSRGARLPTPASESALAAPLAGTPKELAARLELAIPSSGVFGQGDRVVVVRVVGALTVRSTAVRALIPDGAPFKASPAYRRARGRQLEEPLGGVEATLGQLEGSGVVVLSTVAPGARLVPVNVVEGEPLYVREDYLVGFDGGLRHESGRLARGDSGHYPVVQLSGIGPVILEVDRPLFALAVPGTVEPLALASERVVGWTGRLLPRPSDPATAPGGARGFVDFSGDGAIFLLLD